MGPFLNQSSYGEMRVCVCVCVGLVESGVIQYISVYQQYIICNGYFVAVYCIHIQSYITAYA